MAGFKDLKGQRFGKLTVIEVFDRDKFGHYRWLCKCDCNGINSDTIVQSSNLIRGLTTSCRKCNSYYEHPEGYMVGVTAKGIEFYFDKEDFELVKQYVWHMHRDGYITHKDKKSLLMHRLIMNPPDGMDVDHINGDRKDNRRLNLRVCTRQQNLWNMREKGGNSKYIGVLKIGDKFYAGIRSEGKHVHLGIFNTEEEAALAYNEKALELRGEFARLNVIDKGD